MNKFTVTIAVNVPSYCDLEVEAASQEDADRIVAESIKEHSWSSPYWYNAEGWDTDWCEADDLRVLGVD